MEYLLGMNLIKRVKARTSKSIVELWDLGACNESSEDGGRWQTICTVHGNCINHDKKQNALYYLSHPEEWCEDC